MNIIKKLKTDHDFYYGYQANIAMAIYDEYRRKIGKKKYLNLKDIHDICNDGAKIFLNRLITQK